MKANQRPFSASPFSVRHVGTASKPVRRSRVQVARLGRAAQGASSRYFGERPLAKTCDRRPTRRSVMRARVHLLPLCRDCRGRDCRDCTGSGPGLRRIAAIPAAASRRQHACAAGLTERSTLRHRRDPGPPRRPFSTAFNCARRRPRRVDISFLTCSCPIANEPPQPVNHFHDECAVLACPSR